MVELATLTKGEIKALDDKDLLSKRLRLHQLWSTTGGKIKGMTREDFVNLNLLITEEMERRGLKRQTISDLDRATDRLRAGKLMDDIRGKFMDAHDITLMEGFVCSVGSFPDGRVPNDLDILFRQDQRDTSVERAVVEELFKTGSPQVPQGGVETIWQSSGPQGSFIPLYDLVLRKRPALDLERPTYLADWDTRPKPRAMIWGSQVQVDQVVCLEPAPNGERFIAQIRDQDVQIYSTNGELMAVPDLEAVLKTVVNPSIMILDVFWDGEVVQAVDMLRWWSTELVTSPYQHRRLFLDKSDLGLVAVAPYCLAASPETFTQQLETFEGRPVLVRPFADPYLGPDPWVIFQGRQSVKLFKAVTPLKSAGGYGKNEFFQPESAWKLWAQGHADQGVAIEKKFDGIRLQVHVSKEKVAIFTDDRRRDRVHAFPESVKEFLKVLGGKGGVILDSEMVDHDGAWDKPLRREMMINYVVGKGPFDDKWVMFNVFDILFLDGKDLTKLPWKERQAVLRKALPRDTQHMNRVQPIITNTKAEFLAGVKKVSRLKGSEGAMMKAVAGDYPTDGSTGTWAKFKNVKQLFAVVTGKIRKKVPAGQKAPGRTFVYEVAIKDKGKTWPLGRTFGTNIDAKIGTILEMSVNNVFHKKKKGEVVGYGLFLPWVVAQAPTKTKTSTKQYLDTLVRRGGGVARPEARIKLNASEELFICPECEREFRAKDVKLMDLTCPKCHVPLEVLDEDEIFESYQAVPKDEGELTQEQLVAKVQALTKPYMVKQPKNKTQPFVFQWHARGIPEGMTDAQVRKNLEDGTGETMSVHGDLRFQRPAGLDLVGWTMFTPGNQRKRDKFSENRTWRDRIQVTKKAVQPRAWLKVQGRSKAGEVGATTKTDAYFMIKGTGRMTYGTQKPFKPRAKEPNEFHEYFLKFDQKELQHLNGRWIVREIARPGREEGSSKGGDAPTIWQMTKPKEQRPYIDTHDLSEKEPVDIWQYIPVPGLEIPRAKQD